MPGAWFKQSPRDRRQCAPDTQLRDQAFTLMVLSYRLADCLEGELNKINNEGLVKMKTDHDDITNRASVKIPVKELTSWEKFKSYVSTDILSRGSLADPNPRYLFRGQGDAESVGIKVRENI
jgi:hypothetical protein